MLRFTNEQVGLVKRLQAEGASKLEIERHLQVSYAVVERVLALDDPLKDAPESWKPRAANLRADEREEIHSALARGESMSSVARRLGRARSTVTREVKKNGGVGHYGSWRAHCRAHVASKRPKASKFSANLCLKDQVTEHLLELWSPMEISRRLRLEHPGDPTMQVSHETIYQSLYVQGRGELKRELTRCLRSGRAKRVAHDANRRRGQIRDMVKISERPPEAEDRAVPGHWEGDLIMGKNNRSAVGTLVERSTRFCLLLHLADGHKAKDVELQMTKVIQTLPKELARSVTWDQGKEMALHKSFTVSTGVPVYFCDPHSPWQRGSNENTNGLLRQYMPKGTDLSTLTEDDLVTIQRGLNNRPRETLGFLKPCEKFAELVALTT